jgi:hypothetical protein
VEQPANVEGLPDPRKQYAGLRSQLKDGIEKGVMGARNARDQARAAYLAICLDFALELMQKDPEQWSKAVTALRGYPKVLQVIFYESPIPAGQKLAEKAVAAGVRKPAKNIQIWT